MKKFIIPAVVLSVALLLLFAIRGHWDMWRATDPHPSTNDAYVTSNQMPLSTRITGTVRQVAVSDYANVKAGQLILQLEDTEYKATVDEAMATIEAAKAQLAQNQSVKRSADAMTESARLGIAQAESAVDAAKAAVTAQQAQVDRAASEYRRQAKLLEGQATTQQQFEQALEARDASQASLATRNADMTRSQAAADSSKEALLSAQQKRTELDASDASLRAQIRAKEAVATVAKVNLGYAAVYAPADGQIGRFQVHPGQLLSAGVSIVDFVQSGPWVEANFQETQLARVRPGDLASITIDAYPGRSFRAYVSDIAPASGAATALLPPDNATGNFTKVVQRVPVKLRLENNAEAMMLRPGLSAHVTVDTEKTSATRGK